GYTTSYQTLVFEEHRAGAFLSASYRFSDSLEVFAEALASRFRIGTVSAPPFLQLTSVPASNAFNPFRTTVRVSGVVKGAEPLTRVSFKDDLLRPLIGARGSIGAWYWELTALESRDSGSQIIYGQPNTSLLNSALASSDPAATLNP